MSDMEWDPRTYDNVIKDMEAFYDANDDEFIECSFDSQGNYLHRSIAIHTMHPESEYFDAYEYPDYGDLVDDIPDYFYAESANGIYKIQELPNNPRKRDYELLQPLFAWAPAETIQRTIAATASLTLSANIGSLVSLHAISNIAMRQ